MSVKAVFLSAILVRQTTGSRLLVSLLAGMTPDEWLTYVSIKYPGWELSKLVLDDHTFEEFE